ncbi:MAG: hypothetical protein KF797_04215 [Flavobacteriales bacterium]|nr:hypothetical protein [Flavobacteriales bacterium]
MSTAELRKRVIARVKLSKDAVLLRELDRMLKEAGERIAVYELDAKERRAVQKGLEDVKKGRVLSAEKANKAAEKWLSK